MRVRRTDSSRNEANADAFETPTLLHDEVRQRGMMVPGQTETENGREIHERQVAVVVMAYGRG